MKTIKMGLAVATALCVALGFWLGVEGDGVTIVTVVALSMMAMAILVEVAGMGMWK